MPVTHTSGLPLPAPPAPPFAQSVSADGRSIIDQYGAPWLMLSDQLLPGLTNGALADMNTVMADRQTRGYNAVWVCLINDAYIGATDNHLDNAGNAPFTGAGLTGPTAAYWTRVDSFVASAATYGITCILTPIETAGTSFALARTAGSAGCNAYGQFLGNRYKSSPNIIWLHGNDFGNSGSWIGGQPPNFATGYQAGDNALALQMVAGLTTAGDGHLQTAELNFDISLCTDDASVGGFRSLMQLTQAYTYYKTYDCVLKGYLRINSNDALSQAARFAAKPVFMGEANYEGADNLGGGANPAAPRVLRAQNYWTLLAGGLGGQIWGNKILHHFSSGWQTNLNTTGANDAARWAAFFRSVAFQKLVPDVNNTFVTGGFGTYDGSASSITPTPGTYATAASTPDGKLGICYTPVNQGLVVALATMSGSGTARWFDPTNGTYTSAGSFTNTGTHTYTPSATNSAGDTDWVLVLTVP